MEGRKRSSLPIIILILIIVLAVRITSGYNKLIVMNEAVESSWAEVENQLTRRASLIPNLLETVKGYAGHEKEVIKNISDARTGYSSASSPEEYARANEDFTKAINNLNLVVENYPDLKANENFKDLQVELAGTENRISVARMRYNEEVKGYNSKIKSFPTNISAKIFGFQPKEYFEASESDKEVPKIEF